MKNNGYRLIILLLITIGWLILMRKMTAPLDLGIIITFEFIGSADKAMEFLSRLKDLGHLDLLTRSIFLDFIFSLLYGATFYYASLWVCSKLPQKHRLNRFQLLSSLIVVAVFSDLIENVSLLKLIYYPPADMYAYSAFFFAGLKFLFLTIVVLHFISSIIIVFTGKKSS